MGDSTLTAGVARVDITPPVGFRMQGAMRRTEGSVGVESRLLATALVRADEDPKTGRWWPALESRSVNESTHRRAM